MSEFPLQAGDCEALLGGLGAGILISDESDRVVWANRRICELLDVDAASIEGKRLGDLLGEPFEKPADSVERFRVGNGAANRRWLECVATRRGELSLRVFTDITGFLVRPKARSAVVWGLDPLRLDPETGVLNRRTILQELNSQISRSRRYGNALGVIELGIATDAAALEEARQEVAECLKNTLRWADFIGTLSEEAFLVVLPETDAGAMHAVAEKIREAWDNPATPRASAPVTLHFATTSWQEGDNLDAVLKRLVAATDSAGPDGR